MDEQMKAPGFSGFNADAHKIKVQGGRQYLPVSARILWFRQERPDWGIVTEDVSTDKVIAFRATIFDASGRIISTGTKRVKPGTFSDEHGKAETGSVGRALFYAGYGDMEDDDEVPATAVPPGLVANSRARNGFAPVKQAAPPQSQRTRPPRRDEGADEFMQNMPTASAPPVEPKPAPDAGPEMRIPEGYVPVVESDYSDELEPDELQARKDARERFVSAATESALTPLLMRGTNAIKHAGILATLHAVMPNFDIQPPVEGRGVFFPSVEAWEAGIQAIPTYCEANGLVAA